MKNLPILTVRSLFEHDEMVLGKPLPKSLLCLACVTVWLLASIYPTSAASPATPQDKRETLIGYIRTTSDCFAREAIKHPDFAIALRTKDWAPFLRKVMPHCKRQIDTLIHIHDRFYGRGSGLAFFNGGYFKDLPRAIRARIPNQVTAAIAKTAPPPAPPRAEHATPPQRGEERKAPALPRDEKSSELTVKEADHGPVTPIDQKAAALYLARVEMRNLRAKLYECTDQNVAQLARTGIALSELTSLAVDRCRTAFDAAFQSVVKIFAIDANLQNVDETQKAMLREEIMKVVREHIVSAAVTSEGAPQK